MPACCQQIPREPCASAPTVCSGCCEKVALLLRREAAQVSRNRKKSKLEELKMLTASATSTACRAAWWDIDT
jgi:hypothetical protein